MPLKIYAADLGMTNAITLERIENRERWAENTMAIEEQRRGSTISHWREGREVDIVIPLKKRSYQVCYGEKRKKEILAFEGMPFTEFDRTLITLDEFDPKEAIPRVPLWTYLLSEH